MHVEIAGSPAFSHLKVRLDPGESIVAESGAMASMDGRIQMLAILFGSFVNALARFLFGGESLFASRFTNPTQEPRSLVLTQKTPGDIRAAELSDTSLCLEPGAFVAATPGVSLSLRWAGIASWFGGEGLFKLLVEGRGTVWFGAYGAIVSREVNGELLIDSGHVVAYSPDLTLGVSLAGGIFSSLFGGEGFVTRVRGKGTVLIGTRSLNGLTHWLNQQFH